jgi:ERCC4-related helicase
MSHVYFNQPQGAAAAAPHEAPDNVPTLSKLDALLRIVEANPGGKFIVFSNHSGSFREIRQLLSTRGISNSVLCGQSSLQNKTVEGFMHGSLRVIMLNASYSGSGIDLHSATDVILYQQLDSSTETQVIGRANRPGRDSALRVHQLLHSNEAPADADVTIMR